MKTYSWVLLAMVGLASNVVTAQESRYTIMLGNAEKQYLDETPYKVVAEKPISSVRNKDELSTLIGELRASENEIVLVKVKAKAGTDVASSSVYMHNSSLPGDLDFQKTNDVTTITRSEGYAKMLSAIESTGDRISKIEIVFANETATRSVAVTISNSVKKSEPKVSSEATPAATASESNKPASRIDVSWETKDRHRLY